ncbi:MAG TPA: redox-sensing transcriptional repressor Rex [Anaerolineales bacterium]|nr:redox-sensing transcriptional repressor Rex [Anaerolineales bacterium]
MSIPTIVINRLPVYLRELLRLEAEGQSVTSSQELARRLGMSSAQIRKDLSHFGEFGKQGTGYRIDFLRQHLQKILKVEREWDVALIGAGDLGQAIAHNNSFAARGFRITCIFDSSSARIGTTIAKLVVQSTDLLEVTLREKNIRIGLLAIPAEHAQKVTDRLVKAGIVSILNYAPVNLSVPETVRVQYMDPVIQLQRMTYYHL